MVGWAGELVSSPGGEPRSAVYFVRLAPDVRQMSEFGSSGASYQPDGGYLVGPLRLCLIWLA